MNSDEEFERVCDERDDLARRLCHLEDLIADGKVASLRHVDHGWYDVKKKRGPFGTPEEAAESD